MVPRFTLTLLLASTVSAEIRCDEGDTVPSVASCNVALRHLARYLLPCANHETVNVSSKMGGKPDAQIKLPAVFVDTRNTPLGTSRCRIDFEWHGEEGGFEIIQPGKLQTFARSMEDQCIAASPPKTAVGKIDPNELIRVEFRSWSYTGSTANLAMPGVDGTLMSGQNGTISTIVINPMDACRNGVEPYRVQLDNPQPLADAA